MQQEVCYRARGAEGRLDLEGRRKSEDLQLTYLLPWLAQPFGVGDWGKVMSRGGKFGEEDV